MPGLTLDTFAVVVDDQDTGVRVPVYLRVIEFYARQEGRVKEVWWNIGAYSSKAAFDAGLPPISRLRYEPRGEDADLEKSHPEMFFPIIAMLEQISLATKDVVSDPGDPANDIPATMVSRIEGAVDA